MCGQLTYRTGPVLQALLLSTMMLGMTGPAAADQLIKSQHGRNPVAMEAVHDAEHEVDHAWEVFHRTALGGTLASPDIQADVEQALHESRGLLVKAREAADRGDRETLQPLLNRIYELTARAIKDSQEKKQ